MSGHNGSLPCIRFTVAHWNPESVLLRLPQLQSVQLAETRSVPGRNSTPVPSLMMWRLW